MGFKVTTAIFPVAGMGTRFLPATKAIPKEILTLVDKPLIEYAMDEARAAGIRQFVFVTAKGKGALEDYFDVNSSLESALRRERKTELLATLRGTNVDSGNIAYVRQNSARGLGHAVWCARRLINDSPFAVILPDDLIIGDKPCLGEMLDAYAGLGGNMVATMEVAAERASSYGMLELHSEAAQNPGANVLRARGMVEKPAPGTAPSSLAVIGRYILMPSVMTQLGRKIPGAGGEIQLTDAIVRDLGNAPLHGFRFTGTRYDCGSKAGFLQATVALALARGDLRGEFFDFLQTIVGAGQPATATKTNVTALRPVAGAA